MLDIRLDGTKTGTVNMAQYGGRVSSEGAARFLAANKTAKIVVVIDTHCLEETGSFVWRGSEPCDYEACLLPHVSTKPLCIPWSHLTHR